MLKLYFEFILSFGEGATPPPLEVRTAILFPGYVAESEVLMKGANFSVEVTGRTLYLLGDAPVIHLVASGLLGCPERAGSGGDGAGD